VQFGMGNALVAGLNRGAKFWVRVEHVAFALESYLRGSNLAKSFSTMAEISFIALC
jgi:hypothetical protein